MMFYVLVSFCWSVPSEFLRSFFTVLLKGKGRLIPEKVLKGLTGANLHPRAGEDLGNSGQCDNFAPLAGLGEN